MNRNEKINGGGIHLSLSGKYKAQVVNAANEIVADYGWHPNLILNQGMDRIATEGPAANFAYCAAGTGSRPNKITGSTSTITQSGANLFLYERTGLPDFTSSYSTYTASVNVGDVIQYGNLSKSMVTAITDGFNLVVTPSYTIAEADSQSFTIWKTSQVSLEGEYKRTSNYLSGLGNCGTTANSVINHTHRRTYDFTAETSLKNYTEIGVGWSGTVASATIFSRILLPIPISVDTDYRLRVIYDLNVSYAPATEQYITATISGWTNTEGTESIQKSSSFTLPTINWTGGGGGGKVLDPTDDLSMFSAFVSSNTQSLSSVGDSTDRSSNAAIGTSTIIPYIPNSYTLYKQSVFDVDQANISTIRSIGFGYISVVSYYYPYATPYQGMCILLNQSQSKIDTQTLTLVWKWEWDRTLE